MKVPTHAHRRYLQDKQKEIYRLVTVTIATGRKEAAAAYTQLLSVHPLKL